MTEHASSHETESSQDPAERFRRGMLLLQRIGGVDFDGPINRLSRLSKDMARFTVEYPYGDVLSRPGLDLRLRQICTISALMAQASLQPQLKFHMEGLLNVGGTPDDLVELLFLSTAMLGFPIAIDSIGIVRDIFKERGLSFSPRKTDDDDGTDRYRRGLGTFRDLMGADPATFSASVAHMSAELARWALEFVFGDVMARDGLAKEDKHLAIISMLGATGNRSELLRLHLRAAVTSGVALASIAEAIMQLSVYAGFPAALNGFTLLSAVLEDPLVQHPTMTEPHRAPEVEDAVSESRQLRRSRGLAALAATSSASGEAVVHSFDDVAPEIGSLIVEFCYGDIFHRPGIDAKTRELTACAALAARGAATDVTPLRVHIRAAIKAGARKEEIVEILLNMLPYSGYPAIRQAMILAGEEFAAIEQ
ncbi:carboxymuconolactone decarboxylase family protein [Azospirillum lipoferum]|uniref:Carboxymuconolactone decarboxylase family protein n=3 Tax=Azospirillum TaxID=191 RepID=A0A5A9GR54_AZOLI|nr:carboxymuconolactone decarboxylase family protein [Azospirillum lipoferum]